MSELSERMSVIDDVDGALKRPMTLDEWCGRLPDEHRVNRGLKQLKRNANAAGVVIAVALILGVAVGVAWGWVLWATTTS